MSDLSSNTAPASRWPRRAGAALVVVAVALLASHFSADRPASLEVRTEPSGACLWLDGEFIGKSPAVVTRVAPGTHLLVARKSGYETRRCGLRVRGGRQQVRAYLRPAAAAALEITSEPSGALALVDGAERGRTPLVIEGLPPGRRRVRLVKNGYAPCEADVTLSPGRRVKLHRALDSHVEAFYLKRLEKDPGDFYDISELAHHYVLKRDFEKAEQTLLRAAKHLTGQPFELDSERRLYYELVHIHEPEFDYGGPQEVEKGRRMVRRVFDAYIRAKPKNAYARYYYATTLLQEGKYEEAGEQLDAAERCPHDARLARLLHRARRRLYR